jgi:hypothetical protein
MRGKDLATNLEFHYGLVNWFIGQNINARPTTRFIVPYLTAVGELARGRDPSTCPTPGSSCASASWRRWGRTTHRPSRARCSSSRRCCCARSENSWRSRTCSAAGSVSTGTATASIDGRVSLDLQPDRAARDLYHFLNMDYAPGAPAATMIWEHDHELLQGRAAFTRALASELPDDWTGRHSCLARAGEAPAGCDIGASQWAAVRAAHRGFQSGTAILGLLPAIAEATDSSPWASTTT